MKRAGADAILTYFALDAARWLRGQVTTCSDRQPAPRSQSPLSSAQQCGEAVGVEPHLLAARAGRGVAAAAPLVRADRQADRTAPRLDRELGRAVAVALRQRPVAATAVEQRAISTALASSATSSSRMSLCSVAQPAATPPTSSGRERREPRIQASASSRCARSVAACASPPNSAWYSASAASISSSPGSAVALGQHRAGAPPCAWRATSRRCRARRSAGRRPARSSHAGRRPGRGRNGARHDVPRTSRWSVARVGSSEVQREPRDAARARAQLCCSAATAAPAPPESSRCKRNVTSAPLDACIGC